MLSAGVLVLVPIAAGTSTPSTVHVTIGKSSCRVAPRTLDAGDVSFLIANRSRRPASFHLPSKRARVAAGRTTRLSISLRVGKTSYACIVGGRSIARGVLTLVPPVALSQEHQIAVREVSGFGEFYDRTTGAGFVPRGHEYVRLGPQLDGAGNTVTYFTNFNVGRYDPDRSESALERMAADGYNVVTVAVNAQCALACAVDTASGRLRSAYFANVADFLRRAKRHGVYVMLGTQFIVGPSAYANLINSDPRELVDDINLIVLTDGGIRAYAEFWTEVVGELQRHRAPLDAIFAYEIWDEIYFTANRKPFTLSAGTLRAPNGLAYDLASEGDRRRLMDDSLVYWFDRIRAAIRIVDPTALVTVGLFAPQEPNVSRVGDPRVLSTRGLIERSTADFVDVHAYPVPNDISLPQIMENFGAPKPTSKPLLMGEFGAFRFAFPTPAAAAAELVGWQRDSCRYGIDGWILWTWDSDPEQPELWSALSGGGAIEAALAPKNRPNPCA